MGDCQKYFDCKNAGKFDACFFVNGKECVEYKSIQFDKGYVVARKELEGQCLEAMKAAHSKLIDFDKISTYRSYLSGEIICLAAAIAALEEK